MNNLCSFTGERFEVADEDLVFLDQVSPVVAGQKLSVPTPKLSPWARHLRRFSWRNERYLYRTECTISKKPIVSVYSPDKPYKVCERAKWLEIDNKQFGREFDFNRPFFEQFTELYHDCYKANVVQDGEMLNSEYNHFVGWSKNCYWMFDSGKNEDCMYGVLVAYSKNCLDGQYVLSSELCYDCFRVEDSYNVFHSSFVKNCSFSAYLYDCIGCHHCIGCTNLRNKEYHVFNKYVGKEEFEKNWQYYLSGSFQRRSELSIKFDSVLAQTPRRPTFSVDCEQCTGDNMHSCQNVNQSFDVTYSRNCKYCYDFLLQNENCYDISTFGEGMSFSYELSGSGGAQGKTGVSNCLFGVYIFYGGHNVLYSTNCHEHCSDVLGCTDLRRAQHCVLNKQYSKEEYEQLVIKIAAHMRKTGEWGEFFPMHLSPFGYNESLAHEDLPLSKEQVVEKGLSWSSYENPPPDLAQVIDATELPDSIAEIDDSILKTAIRCAVTKKIFRLMPAELSFYRKLKISLPRLHPEQRQKENLKRRNSKKLFNRNCVACEAKLLTSYSPDKSVTVLCENCYKKKIY